MQPANSIFDPVRFEETSKLIVSALTRYLGEAFECGTSLKRWVDPPELVALAASALESAPSRDEIISLILDHSRRLHSPHTMGHQVAPVIPESALFDLIGKLTNQGTAVYEMGPFSVAAERAVIEKMAQKIGWRSGFGGIATHGGTLANLTAILAARSRAFKNAWTNGTSGLKPTILASSDSHYSISRASGICGMGANSVIGVGLDSGRRMDVDELKKAYQSSIKRGETPFCVVATAGTTPVGAFDPIRETAMFCQEEKLWLHVDGAHGASVLFSEAHRQKVSGIELADSVTWDAHKMLFVPSLSTFLLYRNSEDGEKAFSQDAPYLLENSSWDAGTRTLECTRGSVALGLWAIWALYGEGLFAKLLEATFETTRLCHELLHGSSTFEAQHLPESNILCFRFSPTLFSDAKTRSLKTQSIRERISVTGKYYLTNTRLNDEKVFRVTLMHPMTQVSDFEALLAEIASLAQVP